MKRGQKRLLWYRGAKFSLKSLMDMEGDRRNNAEELLKTPGMTRVLRDDYWARGFVAMLKRQAKMD